jgi:predicted membrane-bound mannosyltransferase
LKNDGCVNCKYPLNWSFTEKPSISSIFIPNFISLRTRLTHLAISLALILYSVYGIVHDKIDLIYGRKYSSTVIVAHFHGYKKLIPLLGILVVIASLLSTFIDHYDKRQNERFYQLFSFYCLLAVIIVYTFAGVFADSVTRL